MRLSCKKFLLLLFPLLLICALIGLTACNDAKEPDNTKPALDTPQIELTENVISWNYIEHAGNYEIYEDSTLVKTVMENSYKIEQTANGTYNYKIKALSADDNFSSSKFSNEVVFVLNNEKLSAPKIAIADGVITWESVEHADGYEVYEDNQLISLQSETAYTVNHTETGMYKYTVKATNTSSEYAASELSNEVTYIISERLGTPQLSLNTEDKTISWTAVENADHYVIYLNGDRQFSLYGRTSYAMKQTEVGEYAYYVVAESTNSAVYKRSEKSNEVVYIIEPIKLETPSGLKEERDTAGHVTLTWNEIEGADGYVIYENNRIIEKRWIGVSYPIDHVETKTYEYKIQAIPARGDKQYIESDVSEPIQIAIEDNRTQLDSPTGVTIKYNQMVDPTDAPDDEFETDILSWNSVENAESYLIYESNKRVYSTTSTEYIIGTAYTIPHVYEFQVKAVAHGTLFKSSELSNRVNYEIPAKADQEYTITLNKPMGFPAQDISVEMYNMGNDGLPATTPISGAKVTISAAQSNGIIKFSNRGKYVAKITSGLPSGYYASTVKLSAATTGGTINIYSRAASTLNFKTGSNDFEASDVGTDQIGLFIAPQKSLYTISTTKAMGMLISINDIIAIDSTKELTTYTFAADQNEAVKIVVNGQDEGQHTYTFSIALGTINQELKIGTGYGDNANVVAGNVDSVVYSLNLTEDTEFTFFFSTMYLGPTRFATVTINPGEDNEDVYEFDGGYEYKKNIFIRAGRNIKIRVDISGSMTDDTMSNIYFSVYPLA